MALSVLQREHWLAPSHLPFFRRHLSQALQTRLRMPRAEFRREGSADWVRKTAEGIVARKKALGL